MGKIIDDITLYTHLLQDLQTYLSDRIYTYICVCDRSKLRNNEGGPRGREVEIIRESQMSEEVKMPTDYHWGIQSLRITMRLPLRWCRQV